MTATGTATDTGGGRVAGVEVSTDDGATWHPATGTTSWSYTYVQHGIGSTTVRGAGHRRQRQHRRRGDPRRDGRTARAASSARPRPGRRRPPTTRRGRARPALLAARPTASSPGSASTRAPATPAPTSARCGAPAGSSWPPSTFSERDGDRLADGDVLQPGRGHRGPDLRRVVHRPAGPLRRGPVRVLERGHQRRPAHGRRRLRQPAGRGLRQRRARSRTTATRTPTTTSTRSSPRPTPRRSTVTDQWPLAGVVERARRPRPCQREVLQARRGRGRSGLVLKDPAGATVAGRDVVRRHDPDGHLHPTAALGGFVELHGDRRRRPTPRQRGRQRQDLVVHDGEAAGRAGRLPVLALRRRRPCRRCSRRPTPTRSPSACGSRSDTAGTVTGVRFYKGTNNTGTHTGTLWSGRRRPARDRHVHRRVDDRVADADVRDARSRSPRTRVRRVLPRAGGPLVGDARTRSRPATCRASPLTVGVDAGSYTYGTGFPLDAALRPTTWSTSVFQRRRRRSRSPRRTPPPGAVDVPRGTPIRVWFSDPDRSPGYTMTVTSRRRRRSRAPPRSAPTARG